MGRLKQVVDQILVFVALGISSLMTWNYATNLHTHVRPDGTTITHAHPFHNSDEPLSGSNHTRSELYLLQTLMVITMPNVCIALEQVYYHIYRIIADRAGTRPALRALLHKKGRDPPHIY